MIWMLSFTAYLMAEMSDMALVAAALLEEAEGQK